MYSGPSFYHGNIKINCANVPFDLRPPASPRPVRSLDYTRTEVHTTYSFQRNSDKKMQGQEQRLCAQQSINKQPATKKRKLNEVTPGDIEDDDKELVIFQGRDKSYPDKLNRLIKPLFCQLCKVQLTSMKSAKDHYESKSHDRHISSWFAKNYTEVGLPAPPYKHFVQEGACGPNAYHCDLCDLSLTSMSHATQHFSGRKHKLVEQKLTKPSGNGYYNSEGKWVRTTFDLAKANAERFGIGEKFLTATTDITRKNEDHAGTIAADEDHRKGGDNSVSVNDNDDDVQCKVCRIRVTSASQMEMHLLGAKHQKKLRILNIEPTEQPELTQQSAAASLSDSSKPASSGTADGGLAMYRTPSGSYYCNLCNEVMNHISNLQQHLQGKRHAKHLRHQALNSE